ncbi:hypothetical protein PanWU01x14_122410 [Parasponia andersonii]|uniref:Uncharacterized protein n=1 Tax=Parasponia andersonii TaxID=3476 RepID=A0A2P5CUZ4_PARAD|nr:hypothetical protein PanWU01x14_122410 [Parasponia andersonii]
MKSPLCTTLLIDGPSPSELKLDEAEDEQERGIRRPFVIIKDDEVYEYGMSCFRCKNGELLRARDHDTIESIELDESTNKWLGRIKTNKERKEADEEVKKRVSRVL